MSATRLLVLGVVRQLETAHGYRVRAELVSWGAEEWANIKWGSLYHALRQMASEGMLTSVTSAQWPGRVDYRLTPAGSEEFLRLLRDAIRQPGHRSDMLAAGLALLDALPEDEAIGLFKERLAALEAKRADDLGRLSGGPGDGASWHLREVAGLWAASADSSIAWTRGLIERLEERCTDGMSAPRVTDS